MKLFSTVLVILTLSSCTPAAKVISGTVKIAGTGSQGSNSQNTPVAEFVPGEVLVSFKTDLSAQSLSSMSVGGVSLQSVRPSALERTNVYHSDTLRSQAETLALVAQLKARPDVAWAEPNQILRALAQPNDPAYLDGSQWHYDAINLPQAWDLEKGLTIPITVAVVDTGLLLSHPDIAGNFLPGYDFISSSQQSNDGNGRENNPDDPGDNPGGQGSYHGSHVAGTIAAATNNGIGVAGVSWGAKILPVRVLGVDGGSTSDIIDGILWAAGLPVTGVPANKNPAKIINLSLGGAGLCESSSSLQRTLDQVNAQGAIIVVAAGNENVEAADTIPASCSGVITVGATNRAGSRAAQYSNYGPRVDVMAPGGEGSGGNVTNEVLSLDKNDAKKQFAFGYKQGTSMATPHVAGLLALMKSKDPNLSFSRALSILKRSARPLTATQCSGTGTGSKALLPSDCGAGLIDAFAALNTLNTNPDFSLTLKPSSVIAERGQSVQIQVTQSNFNGFATNANLQFINPDTKNPLGSATTLGSISGSTLTIKVPSNQPFGTYSLRIQGNSGVLLRDVSLSLNVIDVNAPVNPIDDISGTDIIFCNYVNNVCDRSTSKVISITKNGSFFQYTTPELTGSSYIVAAWKDVNTDNKINKGDLYGGYFLNNDFAFILPPANNINIDIYEIVSVLSVGTPNDNTQILLNAIQQVR
jgi:serine protease